MTSALSLSTQAILLLTAPLIAGRGPISPDLLTNGEYKRLARHLHQKSKDPADLLSVDVEEILLDTPSEFDVARLKRLLARGFALSQAIDRWQTRGIWVVSRADADYPQRIRHRLRDDRPTVLYGCGDQTILDKGGLAVVGSRDVSDVLIEYTLGIGRLTAMSREALVSGGARGIDQAAMRGALEAGGKVAGVMADNLEKAVMNRENRSVLMEGQLVLVSPYDPGVGFQNWQAMQRNKLIYALADAALVVNSDLESGGTWNGAVEQLKKLRFAPVYVRSDGYPSKALAELQKMGALPWPNPVDSDGFIDALKNPPVFTSPEAPQAQLTLTIVPDINTADSGPAKVMDVVDQSGFDPSACAEVEAPIEAEALGTTLPVELIAVKSANINEQLPLPVTAANPADALFAAAKQQFLRVLVSPKKLREIATELRVDEGQVKKWLEQLIEDRTIVRTRKDMFGIPSDDFFD